MTKAIFERMTRGAETSVAKLLASSGLARTVPDEPAAISYIYDTLALAYLVDPTYATDVKEMWVDVDCNWGPSYGRTLGYEEELPAKLLQKAKVVRRFDNERFFKLYVDLMTRPTPASGPARSDLRIGPDPIRPVIACRRSSRSRPARRRRPPIDAGEALADHDAREQYSARGIQRGQRDGERQRTLARCEQKEKVREHVDNAAADGDRQDRWRHAERNAIDDAPWRRRARPKRRAASSGHKTGSRVRSCQRQEEQADRNARREREAEGRGLRLDPPSRRPPARRRLTDQDNRHDSQPNPEGFCACRDVRPARWQPRPARARHRPRSSAPPPPSRRQRAPDREARRRRRRSGPRCRPRSSRSVPGSAGVSIGKQQRDHEQAGSLGDHHDGDRVGAA